MSRLIFASMAVITALCGLVFAIGFLILLKLQLPANLMLPICAAFSVGIVLLQYCLGPVLIDQIVRIRWTTPSELGPDFAYWLSSTCTRFRIPTPRFGIIEEGSPNAFTYGNGPWNARVVVTRGIIDALDPDELKAVVAHELGHIKHRDFIVMTVVQALVLALYTLYIASRFGNRRNYWYVVIASYVAYQLSYYISLMLSRVREYMADFASAQIMESGNPLSTALVKISYGMGRFGAAAPGPVTYPRQSGYRTSPPATALGVAPTMAVPPTLPPVLPTNYGSDRVTPELMAKLNGIQAASDKKNGVAAPAPIIDAKAKKQMSMQALGAFGIAGAASVRSAVTWQGGAGAIDPDHFTAGARWELYNPWGKIAELLSTHPLTARRIQALQTLNARWSVASAYDFSKIPAGRYQGFLGDLLVVMLPTALGLLAGVFASTMPTSSHVVGLLADLAFGIAGYSVGSFIQLLVKYRGEFLRSRIVGCLAELEVSHVRPMAVKLEGVFTGRVSAGMPWADDYILQDDSGFVACVLHQPFRFLDFIWGWMYSQQFIGQQVIVHGWYRRFGSPFVEISHFEVPALGKTVRSYYFVWALIGSFVCTVIFAGLGFLAIR